jgi:hypothetical protein
VTNERRPILSNPSSAWADGFASAEIRSCLAGNEIVDGYLKRATSDDPMDRVIGIRGLEGAAKDGDLQAYEALRYLRADNETSGLEADLIDLAIGNVEDTNVIPVEPEALWDSLRVAAGLRACSGCSGIVRLTAAMTAIESPELVPQVYGLGALEGLAKDGSVIARGVIWRVANDAARDEDIRWIAARCVMILRGDRLDGATPIPSTQRKAIRILEGNIRSGRKDMLYMMIGYAMDTRPLWRAAADEARRALDENGWYR